MQKFKQLSPDCSTAIAFLRSKNEVKTEVRKAGFVWGGRLLKKVAKTGSSLLNFLLSEDRFRNEFGMTT